MTFPTVSEYSQQPVDEKVALVQQLNRIQELVDENGEKALQEAENLGLEASSPSELEGLVASHLVEFRTIARREVMAQRDAEQHSLPEALKLLRESAKDPL